MQLLTIGPHLNNLAP